MFYDCYNLEYLLKFKINEITITEFTGSLTTKPYNIEVAENWVQIILYKDKNLRQARTFKTEKMQKRS
jgi:hypothetical protein